MKKKILAVTFFSIIIFFSAQNKVEAYEDYIGTYHTGYEAYIMTEKIWFNTYYPADATKVSCTIKAYKGRSILYITYDYWKDYNNSWHYSNSQGYSGYVDSSANISRKALYYVLSRG